MNFPHTKTGSQRAEGKPAGTALLATATYTLWKLDRWSNNTASTVTVPAPSLTSRPWRVVVFGNCAQRIDCDFAEERQRQPQATARHL